MIEKKDYGRAALEFRNAAQVMPKDAEPYYQMGLLSLQQGDPKTAAALFRKTLSLNPAHSEAQAHLASMMAMNRDKKTVEDAEGLMKTLLIKEPDNADALDILAVSESRLGDDEHAMEHFEKAFEKSPQDVKVAWNLAAAKIAQKDLPAAEAVLKKLVENAPKSAPAALQLARFYVGTNKPADAENEVRRALQLDPKNPSALRSLAALEIQAGHPEQAEQTYRTLSQLPDKEYKSAYATYLFREGKRGEATSEIEKLFKQNPDDRSFRNLLVSAYVAQRRYPDAEKLIVAALKKNANDVDALMQRSTFYKRAGKYQEAEQDLHSVIHSMPDSAPAHYALARLHLLEGSEPNARQELSEAVRLDKNLLRARTDLSRLLLRADAKAALDLLDQTPERQKQTAGYFIARNYALLALNRNDEVRQNLDKALPSVRAPELLYQDAVLKIDRKDFSGARKSLDEILQKQPQDVQVLALLAKTYDDQGNGPQATETLREYASKYPKSAPLQALLGDWLQKTGNRGEARGAYAQARTADPNYTPAVRATASMDLADGNLDAARRNIAPVVSSHPKDATARLLLAITEDRAGNRKAALEHYHAVMELDPKNQTAANNLVYLLAADNPDEALKYAQSALELAPENPDAQETLGWIYYRKGIYSSAITYLAQAVKREPTALRQLRLGLAYSKIWEPRLSKQYIDAALRQDPKLAGTERDAFK